MSDSPNSNAPDNQPSGQPPKKRSPQRPPNRDGEEQKPSGFNWRGIILLAFAILLIGFAVYQQGEDRDTKKLTYTEFLTEVEAGTVALDRPVVASFESGAAMQTLSGEFATPQESENGLQKRKFAVSLPLTLERDALLETLREKSPGFQFDYEEDNSMVGLMLINLLPILLILLLIVFFLRQQMKMAGKGAMGFGKSRAKLLNQDKNRVTFKDVAGVDEAKEEVWELVEFLRDPHKFQTLGGMLPKGVLMVGSPGTGKTLLAKAIAGEADVPFFSISGSDFVEMFVGVGASRVRDMFEQGKKNAPCLIFIDEIDAVGRHRGHGMGGGHDEREQTLNQLLVEMDGFDTQDGVIIIAATNRADVLDPALLRPGRFDRQVTVDLPDIKGREEILRVHAKRAKVSASVDLSVIARGTPGYSGAELANVINEAALLAARRGLKAIGMAEMEEARDKVRWGKERRSLALSDKEKENTAVHEAGHAILLEELQHTDPLHKVTIIPRGPSLGSTMWLPEEDKHNFRKNELVDQICVAMGGRVAEEIVFGDVTIGASGDIRQATGIARRMVCEWGMSDKLGMVEYGSDSEPVFVARDMGRGSSYSAATAKIIDDEVKLLIDTAYQRATDILTAKRAELDAIAKALLEYETLDAKHIRQIMETGVLSDPPKPVTPPAVPNSPSKPSGPDKGDGDDEDEDGIAPPDLAGAPA
ncbi:ATP-dependent zinc metalloprotease FtsH [Sulfuriroseicoccus oceanibius]|uniref:ATP-dependent zinc metalloprotease FtsH n=1 Tax=Sulfuriroseicoccus oceanibius TaxID=2707525 RepID=A0A6B3L3W2_9BACT|nr:ATP-dependent zinc metalloprotease FtsH [Sulfuriroseicoccus oceanibius]QQL46174.1 ATP-dependent zinc metalloprotease FtsH [Sulfuriroseicoccus oceanibius]